MTKETNVEVDINNSQQSPAKPYVVNRNVLKQTEIEEATRYDRHIDTRKLLRKNID